MCDGCLPGLSGEGSEYPLSTQAVTETRGIIATYQNQPINALYSSTCGGRTEDAENIFDEKFPYLVSTECEFNHPQPVPFSSSRSFPDWKDAVLSMAGVSSLPDARRFMALPGQGEPSSMELPVLAAFIRESSIQPCDDIRLLLVRHLQQGIVPPSGPFTAKEILFRLIDKKNALRMAAGVLTSWGWNDDEATG